MMKRVFSLFVVLSVVLASLQAQTVIKNPILPGFYPDPAICKVGSDYYVVNSTFVYFPGIPILHSKDLKNWKQIGNAIHRPSQMDFMGEGISRGLFAPAINYNKGTFYITCTDIDNGGNFIVTATNPAGPWSDPIYLKEVKGIDPSLYFEGDRAFIIYNSNAPDNKPLYNGHRTVRIYELELPSLKVKGTETILVNGGVDLSKKPVWIEAPHIYKRDKYYYLMAAEGGTSVNHSEVILRSTDVRGPYIPYEKNPILTQRHLDPNRKDPITSVGHADLVEGPDGKTYAIFLAVRPYEGNHYNTGRETFFAPVKWIDGWPVINPDHEEVQYKYQVPWKEVKQQNAFPTGNFRYLSRFTDSIGPEFLFLRTHNPAWYSLKENKNALTMNLLPETVLQRGNPAFIGRRQQHLVSSASTELDFSTTKENEKAGLLIFQNETHFYYICKSSDKGKDVIQLFKGNQSTRAMDLVKQLELPKSQKKVFFKIDSNNDNYSFSYALAKDKWTLLQDKLDGKFLSTQTAGGFVGCLYAMYATSSGTASDNKAVYRWLDYSGNDKTFE